MSNDLCDLVRLSEQDHWLHSIKITVTGHSYMDIKGAAGGHTLFFFLIFAFSSISCSLNQGSI